VQPFECSAERHGVRDVAYAADALYQIEVLDVRPVFGSLLHAPVVVADVYRHVNDVLAVDFEVQEDRLL